MEITVNGKKTEAVAGATLAKFLEQRGFGAGGAIVEYNGEILAAAGWEGIVLAPGDRMEIVTFVGGG